MKTLTYRQRMTRALRSSSCADKPETFHCADMIQAQRLDQIKTKASAHIERNPSPRAVFLLG